MVKTKRRCRPSAKAPKKTKKAPSIDIIQMRMLEISREIDRHCYGKDILEKPRANMLLQEVNELKIVSEKFDQAQVREKLRRQLESIVNSDDNSCSTDSNCEEYPTDIFIINRAEELRSTQSTPSQIVEYPTKLALKQKKLCKETDNNLQISINILAKDQCIAKDVILTSPELQQKGGSNTEALTKNTCNNGAIEIKDTTNNNELINFDTIDLTNDNEEQKICNSSVNLLEKGISQLELSTKDKPQKTFTCIMKTRPSNREIKIPYAAIADVRMRLSQTASVQKVRNKSSQRKQLQKMTQDSGQNVLNVEECVTVKDVINTAALKTTTLNVESQNNDKENIKKRSKGTSNNTNKKRVRNSRFKNKIVKWGDIVNNITLVREIMPSERINCDNDQFWLNSSTIPEWIGKDFELEEQSQIKQ